MDIYEEQAQYFRNIPLLDPAYSACVHVEDKEDECFWDYHLQSIKPATYYFVSQSKSANGMDTKGCEQCLKYRDYLSDRFFICIDSDLRLLRGEKELDAAHLIAQTYTYSWENHCCEANHLQGRLRERIPEIDSVFDFRVFFNELSKVLYRPLLLLLYCEANGIREWNMKNFNACIPLQPRREQLADNGASYVAQVRTNISEATKGLTLPEGFVIPIREEESYLHVRGHNIYDLTMHIGTMLCNGKGIAFTSEILNANYPHEGYWEVENVKRDLKDIVSK